MTHSRNTHVQHRLLSYQRLAIPIVIGACALSLIAGCSAAEVATETDSDNVQSEASDSSSDVQSLSAEQQEAVDAAYALLDDIASADAETIEALVEGIGFYPTTYGISAEGFASAYYANFSYEQGDISTDEGLVAVNVSFELPDFLTTLAVLDETQGTFGDDQMTASSDHDAAFAEALAEADVEYVSVQCTLLFTQDDDGSWTLQNSSDIAVALLAGYDPRQEADAPNR